MDIAQLLVIDAGNTRIKWGIREGDAWSARGAIATAEAGSLRAHLDAHRHTDAIVASNVAGPQVQAVLEALAEGWNCNLRIITSEARQLGVVNGYDDPRQLGTDRWAALVAAHHAAAGDKLVVNAGTALTIDALLGDGRFLGGVIVPGPAMMRRCLDRGTAALRLAEGRFEAFPRNTADAITSGALQAACGAVMRMAAALGEPGRPPPAIILSGGAAPELAPYLPIPAVIHENLVLEGLTLIARAS
jgi:type III pantothenate kinase